MKKNTSKQHTQASTTTNMSSSLGSNQAVRPDAPEGPDRPARIPMNSGTNLNVPEQLLDRDKFHHRFFAENLIKGGRIESAKGAWWEHVIDPRGKNIMRPSGGDVMYLMKIDIKYWKEDQKLKQDKVRATMEAEATISDGEYAPTTGGMPEGGTTAVTRK